MFAGNGALREEVVGVRFDHTCTADRITAAQNHLIALYVHVRLSSTHKSEKSVGQEGGS